MDLLTILANEFVIPIVNSKRRIWFFRTKAGQYYFDFFANSYIALGWDLIPVELIVDSKIGRIEKKANIQALYPNEKRPGLILSQMDIFYNKMQLGDLVVIPSEGSKEISIGEIGEVSDSIIHKSDINVDYEHCTFAHKRSVSWIKTVDAGQDIYLFKALRAHQTISDITDEAKLILRNLYPVYIAGDYIHLTLQKQTDSELSLACNVRFLSSILKIADKTAELYGQQTFGDEMSLKTAVGSPGFIELISAAVPTSLFAIYIIILAIGKEKSSDGTTATGILALISKVNDLINDYHNRKKTDAETRLLDAQKEKTDAETRLLDAQKEKMNAELEYVRAQTAKLNAETRKQNLEYEQIRILPSGMTTEEKRVESENLIIPDQAQAVAVADSLNGSAKELKDTAAITGLCFNGKKIDKVG